MADEVGHIAHLFLSEVEGQANALTVRALIAEHLSDAEEEIRSVAERLAGQLDSVALLEMAGGSGSLKLFSTGGGGEAAGSGTEEDIGRALSELPKETHLLLVGLGAEDSLLDACGEISVMVGPDPESVVAGYSQLKKLADGYAEALGITVVGCSSMVAGRALAERIRQAAREFLVLPLRIHAIVPENTGVSQRKLAGGKAPKKGALRRIINSLRGG